MTTEDSAPTSLPKAILRRFSNYQDLDLGAHAGFITGRLLEEGDRSDLRWLFDTLGRPAVLAWWRTYGGRSLSRRSQAFWRLRLGECSASEGLGPEVWPLA